MCALQHRLRQAVVGLAAFLVTGALAAQVNPVPAPGTGSALAITFDAQGAAASGVTPHGQAVWLGVSREFPDGVPLVMRRESIATDADGSGTVRYALDGGVPSRSVWVVVDLATGAAVVATPAGYPRREIVLDEAQEVYWGTHPAVAAGGEAIVDVRGLLDLLVVRPKVGAWGARVGKGGVDDEDPTHAKLRTTLAHLHPLGTSPAPPAKFQAEDVVVVIDPNRLAFSLWHLGRGQGPSGKEAAR